MIRRLARDLGIELTPLRLAGYVLGGTVLAAVAYVLTVAAIVSAP